MSDYRYLSADQIARMSGRAVSGEVDADDLRILEYIASGPAGINATFDRDRARRIADRIKRQSAMIERLQREIDAATPLPERDRHA